MNDRSPPACPSCNSALEAPAPGATLRCPNCDGPSVVPPQEYPASSSVLVDEAALFGTADRSGDQLARSPTLIVSTDRSEAKAPDNPFDAEDETTETKGPKTVITQAPTFEPHVPETSTGEPTLDPEEDPDEPTIDLPHRPVGRARPPGAPATPPPAPAAPPEPAAASVSSVAAARTQPLSRSAIPHLPARPQANVPLPSGGRITSSPTQLISVPASVPVGSLATPDASAPAAASADATVLSPQAGPQVFPRSIAVPPRAPAKVTDTSQPESSTVEVNLDVGGEPEPEPTELAGEPTQLAPLPVRPPDAEGTPRDETSSRHLLSIAATAEHAMGNAADAALTAAEIADILDRSDTEPPIAREQERTREDLEVLDDADEDDGSERDAETASVHLPEPHVSDATESVRLPETGATPDIHGAPTEAVPAVSRERAAQRLADIAFAQTQAGEAVKTSMDALETDEDAFHSDGGEDGFLDLSKGGTNPGSGPVAGSSAPLQFRRYSDGRVVTWDGEEVPDGQAPPTGSTVSLPYGSGEVLRRIGDYDVIGELGRGGMGVVYKAYSLRLRRYVAIKVITSGENASEAQILRFHNEAALAARLSHPNIVSIFDSGEEAGLHYFVMEYVEGRSLTDLCRSRESAERELAVRVVAKTARALGFAHRKGVVHRDVKPDNILIDAEGEPHITDFGIAKAITEGDETGLTAFGQAVGTPNYMPPEQANGELTGIGPRSDVYSLGATLYNVLSGSPPFHKSRGLGVLVAVLGKEPEPVARVAHQHKLPPVELDLQIICQKAMQKEAAGRYDSADALADDLERALNDEPIQARPIGVVERMQRRLRRSKGLLVGAFAVFSVLSTLGLAFGVVTVYNIQRSDESLREKDLTDAENQAKTLVGAIKVNMLLGRADAARRLLENLAGDPDIGSIKVVRTDRTIAYTDNSTRLAVERRLAKDAVIAKVTREDPEFLDKIDDLRKRAFTYIDSSAKKRDETERFEFDDKVWKAVVGKLETRTLEVREDGTPYLYVLRPIKNAKACHVCHGEPSDLSYGPSNEVRAVLVVQRSQEGVEAIISENRRTTLMIGGATIGAFLLLLVLFYKVFGVGVPKRRFATPGG